MLSAAPLSEATLVAIDKLMAATLWNAAGVAKGRSTAWAFLKLDEGGLGALSAVAMQREVALVEGLAALNLAADTPQHAGLANTILLALDQRRRDGGVGGEFLAPSAGEKRPQQDILDGMRHAVAQLGWVISDRRRSKLSRRRWDCTLSSALAEAPANIRKSLAEFQRRHLAAIFLGELCSSSGATLHTAHHLGMATQGDQARCIWFPYLEKRLGVTKDNRQMDSEWQVSDVETGAHGARATMLAEVETTHSEVVLSSDTNQELHEAARALGASYLSVSDGTGGGPVSGFAVRVVYDEMQSTGRLGIGWARGRVRSDKAELAGLIQQLRWAPDRPNVWLASDCNAMLSLLEKARTASAQFVWQHEHRTLLREWLSMEHTRQHEVTLKWVKGHTTRTDEPYEAQRECDTAAGKAAELARGVDTTMRASSFEGNFVLLNERRQPVEGSWKKAAKARAQALALETFQRADRAEATWSRLTGRFASAEWNKLPLTCRQGAAARSRWNATADTVTDAAEQGDIPDRWQAEEKARREEMLHLLRRRCILCKTEYAGGWEAHVTGQCRATAADRTRAETTLANAWSTTSGWDAIELTQLRTRNKQAWATLTSGGTWQGFRLVERDLSKARSRMLEQQAEAVDEIRARLEHKVRKAMAEATDTKQIGRLAAQLERTGKLRAEAQGSKLGVNDGTRAMYNPSEVAPLATQLKGTDAAHHNRTQGQTVSVLQSVADGSTQFIPAKLFEMWEQWKGDRTQTGAFQEAIHALHRQESERAANAEGAQDFWCWWGGFTAWARRHWGKVGELFTGPINRVGPSHGGFSATPSDAEWGLQHDAWAQDWDSLEADLLIGNPPYHAEDIHKFCAKAETCRTPTMGIIPARQGSQDYRKYVEATGGRIMAAFKTRSCSFIPFKFWQGDATLGQDDGRRAPFMVYVVGWRTEVSQAAGREFGTLAQATGAGRWPLLESYGMGEASWRGQSQMQQDLDTDAAQQPATAAHTKVRQERQKQTDKTTKQKETATQARNGDTSFLTREGDAWATVRWWTEDQCPADVAAEDKDTWCRMARWGMIPKQTTDLLRFCGTSERSQKAFTRQCGRALRNAAAASVERSRRAVHEMREGLAADKHTQKAQDRRTEATVAAQDSLKGDRGVWKGIPNDPQRVQQQQLAMETKLVRSRAARAAAKTRDDERTQRETANAQMDSARPAGVFIQVAKGDATAGGQQIEAARQNADSGWDRWEEGGSNRRWQTLGKWWRWQTERNTSVQSTRFQSLIVAQDGVCSRRTEGVRCQKGGYHRQRQTLCGGCRAHNTEAGCQTCGTTGDISTPGWGAVGRWTQLCGECIAGSQALPISTQCGGCGTARTVRATVDGSGSCNECPWTADATTAWMARSQMLCEHAAKRVGARLSKDAMSKFVCAMAKKWAQRESFVGNVIFWSEVVAELNATSNIPVTTRGGRLHGDWEGHTTRPQCSKQATLQEVGVTGGHQTVGTGGSARVDKHRARCRDLPTVRGPPNSEAEEEEEPRWSNITEGMEEEEPEERAGSEPTSGSDDDREGGPEAEVEAEAEEWTAEGDGPAETEERGDDGGGAGKTPGAAWPGSRVAQEARRVGGQRLPAAQGGGGKTKSKKQMDKNQRLEGSGSASTPVASRRGWSGLGGGLGQGGAGGARGSDGQGAYDRPSGKPPD